jgi:hypothetical protein
MAPFIAPIQALTVSGDDFEICRLNPELTAEQAKGAPYPMALYLYGKILYWDTFTDRTKPEAKPNETRWCLNYNNYNKRWYRSANGYAKHT